MNKSEYIVTAANKSNKSSCIKNSVRAFLIGGLICLIGEALKCLYAIWGADEKSAGIYSSLSLIFAAQLMTGIGIFDKVASFAGAGTLVPITGFANAVCAAGMESRPEGFITGVCSDMFKIAGPVLVFGCSLSAVYGIIYYFCTL